VIATGKPAWTHYLWARERPFSSNSMPALGQAYRVRSRLAAGAKRIRTLSPTRVRRPRQPQGSVLTPRWREPDSNPRSPSPRLG
jgi:hypothetical protein